MNIFVLDPNIQKCAKYHVDKHVVKMILEGAQILCSVNAKHGIAVPYKATHHKHPCVLWAAQSIQNWRWLKRLVVALNREYKYRYRKKKNHKSFEVVVKLSEPKLPSTGLTEFRQVMPNKFRVFKKPVSAYRSYYLYGKGKISKWTRRRTPPWFKAKEII